MIVSAPPASAAARVNSSLRILLPPRPRPPTSSRLMRTVAPRVALRRGQSSSGVGQEPRGTRGNVDRSTCSSLPVHETRRQPRYPQHRSDQSNSEDPVAQRTILELVDDLDGGKA